MKRWQKYGLATGLCALCALPAAAQEADSKGGVLLQPRVGWVVSLGSLGRVAEMPEVLSEAPMALRADLSVTLGGGPTVGTAALFDVPGLPVLWRVDLDHAPSLDVRLSGDPAPFDAAATFASAGVVTRQGRDRLEPFGHAGIGFRALQFRASEEDGVAIPEGRVDLLGRFGLGLALNLGPVAVTAETAALMSTFRFDGVGDGAGDRAFHADAAGLLGLRLRIF